MVYAACMFLPFHYFNAEFPMWKSKLEVLADQGEHHNFIIGDSRAIAGIDPKLLGDGYYNLALGGGTPMEGYYMVKKMLANNKRIDTIVVSYAPLHFEQSEMFWDRQLKYGFYNPSDIQEIFNDLNIENELFWNYDGETVYDESDRYGYMQKAYLNYYKFPMQLRPELSKSLLLRGYTNYNVYSEIKSRRGSYDFGRAKESHDLNVEARRQTFRPKQIISKSLEMLFDLAKNNDIKVMYSMMPMNKASFMVLSEAYRDGVIRFEENLRVNYPEVEFWSSPLSYYEDSLFGDSSHLNKLGRQKYTLELKAHLSQGHSAQKAPVTSIQFD